jgi:hypothetical protein
MAWVSNRNIASTPRNRGELGLRCKLQYLKSFEQVCQGTVAKMEPFDIHQYDFYAGPEENEPLESDGS